MANASRKHFGAGAQGKHSGEGAMTEIDRDKIGENQILSNRDKSRHPETRGLDQKGVEIDQMQDTAMNRQDDGKI